MKLLKIIAINLLFISSNFYAQEFEKSQTPDSSVVKITKVGVGIKIGFNFATVSKGNLDKAPDARSNFYVGFNYEIPIIEDVFSLQPEIIYSRQGFEKRYLILEERYVSKYKMDYISVPLVARYYVVRGFSLETGPQFSYNIKDDFKIDPTDMENLNTSDVNKLDFSIIFGLTFQFESTFFVSGRYNRSFTEIIKDSKAKNSVIQLGVGYKF